LAIPKNDPNHFNNNEVTVNCGSMRLVSKERVVKVEDILNSDKKIYEKQNN